MAGVNELIDQLLDREGGIADVGDGKGLTRFGQTGAWLRRWNLPTPQTRAEAAANYLEWLHLCGLWHVVEAGDSLADVVLDVAVMSGEAQAVRMLQVALGVEADGVIGPRTIAALDAADRDLAARRAVAYDMRFKGHLISLDPSKARFAGGWMDRLAQHVERLS